MKFYHTILALAGSVLMSGCSKWVEDSGDRCEPSNNFTLKFEYVKNGTDCFSQHISMVNLFVFDADKSYVDSRMLTRQDLTDNQGVAMNLEPGSYTFVVWGNPYFARFSDFSGATIERATIENATHANGVVYDSDSLFVVTKTVGYVPTKANSTHVETLQFRSAHIKLDVQVLGMLNPTDLPITVEVGQLASRYGFDMTLSRMAVYKQNTRPTAQLQRMEQAMIPVPRFENDNDITIDLKRPDGTSLLASPLRMKQYLSDSQIDVANYQDERLVVQFRTVDLGTTIGLEVVNGSWTDNPIGNGR